MPDDVDELISENETPPLHITKKAAARGEPSITPAQIGRFKSTGTQTDPVSLDVVESGSEADVSSMV